MQQFEAKKDPETVTGQSICSVEQLMESDDSRMMRHEEVIIPAIELDSIPDDTPLEMQLQKDTTSSWLPSFLRLF